MVGTRSLSSGARSRDPLALPILRFCDGIGSQHRDFRPQCFPAACLRLVIGRREIRGVIGPDHHVGNIVESVWCVDVVTTWRAPDSDLSIFCQKAVDAISRTMQRRVGQPMLLQIPEMDAGLIAHL